jgi:hypothetical protein
MDFFCEASIKIMLKNGITKNYTQIRPHLMDSVQILWIPKNSTYFRQFKWFFTIFKKVGHA